ncbi:hypothetical protein ID0688_09330 [Helicobacter pylori]
MKSYPPPIPNTKRVRGEIRGALPLHHCRYCNGGVGRGEGSTVYWNVTTVEENELRCSDYVKDDYDAGRGE